MSSLCLPSSFLFPSTCQQPLLSNGLRLNSNYLSQSFHSRCVCPVPSVGFSSKFHRSNIRHSFVCAATAPEEEGVVAVMNFDELAEKNWSFLESDSDSTVSKEEYAKKTDQIICAGNVVATSKVLVSLGSEEFVDRLIDSSPCQLLLIVHESLLSLACIKERHDKVKCWQGELIFVPEKWAPLDVVFLYFLPGLPFTLEEIFKALAVRCSPGARVVISHLQGRQALEQHRQQYHDIIVSDLPDKITLEKVAFDNSFVMKEFVDDPSFYLTVLEFKT